MEEKIAEDSNKGTINESIFADGTFEMVKQTLLSQIYVFVYPVGAIYTLIASFLLPNKEYSTYKKILTSLKEREMMGPKQFHVDFEMGVIKAI